MKIKIEVTLRDAKQSALAQQGIDGQALFRKKKTVVHKSAKKPSRSALKHQVRKDASEA